MRNIIDNFLNTTTMYRVVLYYLMFLLFAALGLSAFGALSFSTGALLLSAAFLTLVCWATNSVFAYVFEGPTNPESVYITAFILALIITPLEPTQFAAHAVPLGWVAVIAMASKF